MAKIEKTGIRFEGKLYETWPALSKALARAGQNPGQWVKDNANKAKAAFSIGLSEGGVPVLVTDQGTPLGEARDASTLKFIKDIIRSYAPNFDFEANRQFVERIAKGVGRNEDVGIVQNTILSDKDVDILFPGFKSLAEAGLVPASGVEAGVEYNRYKTEVKESYELAFGVPMTDEQFLAIASPKDGQPKTSRFISGFFSFTEEFGQAFSDHFGRPPSESEVQDAFRTGKDASRLAAEFRAADFISANKQDIQSTAGAFNFGGDRAGTFSDEELKALGEQQQGIETELGFDIQRRVALATQRIGRIFQGQAAQGNIQLPGTATRGAPGSRVDVGA